MSRIARGTKVPNAGNIGWSTFKTDMFGRTKVSEPFTIFDSAHRYQDNNDYSDEAVGTASTSYSLHESTVYLNVGTAQGDKLTRETRRVFPYQPGKSLQIMQTFNFGPAKTGVRFRAGYFSRTNGLYLERSGTSTYLVFRSFSTGELREIRIPQVDWNIDPLDGTGPTDLVLDLSKVQIFVSEYEWLGAGSVRAGFIINGVFVGAHQFNHANVIESVYMTTATLPIRYEIENLTATTSPSYMKQICSTVISNGGYLKITETWNATIPTKNVTANYTPLIAIRMASGRTDSVIIPAEISIFPTSSDDFEWALIRNPTLVGGTWTVSQPKNNVEYNIGATTLTGGVRVLEGFFGADNQSAVPATDGEIKNFALQLGRTNLDTPVSDIMVLAAKAVDGTGTIKASIGWYDLV
jgi:hypothetical protein